jgi:hypothetical protein
VRDRPGAHRTQRQALNPEPPLPGPRPRLATPGRRPPQAQQQKQPAAGPPTDDPSGYSVTVAQLQRLGAPGWRLWRRRHPRVAAPTAECAGRCAHANTNPLPTARAPPRPPPRARRAADDPATVLKLRDERLQQLLLKIDGAADREKALEQALEQEPFREFADSVLGLIADKAE